jgi:predicted  nucleic acid-binding Zn-ribbon protein
MYRCSKCGRVFNDGELKMFSHIHDRLPCGDRYCDILSAAEQAVPADRSIGAQFFESMVNNLRELRGMIRQNRGG